MDYSGIKALIMGLGLNGGGLESARFMLKRGASITVTDLRDEKTLKPSIDLLDSSCSGSGRIRYVLGKHEIDDFKKADIVIKNPGVRPDSQFLQASKKIETDISLFLSESPARLSAVTGTKGKSSVSSALHLILSQSNERGNAYLGGNITVSPLTFLDNGLTEKDDVVLELSSFQLGDLKDKKKSNGEALLKPAAAVLTSIMADHLDRYGTMEKYIDDKKNIYRGQDETCVTIAGDDSWGKIFLSETRGRPLVCSQHSGALGENQSGGWIDAESGCGFVRLIDNKKELAVPENLNIPGCHHKFNMLCASLAAYALGVKTEVIKSAVTSYRGIEHRLEFFHEADGVRFYNDSAATIPQAAAACIEALTALPAQKLVLVIGGTDKNLDFSTLVNAAKKAAAQGRLSAVILLAGTGSDKLRRLLAEAGISFLGPYDNIDEAVICAAGRAQNGFSVALSPGCASFGMFLNEFDRGKKWKEAVSRITNAK